MFEMAEPGQENKGSLAIVSDTESEGDDMDLNMGVSTANLDSIQMTPPTGPRGKGRGSMTSGKGRGSLSGQKSEGARLEVKLFVSVPPPVPNILSENDSARCCILITSLPVEITDTDLKRYGY